MSYLVDSANFNEAWFFLELLIVQTCVVVFLYGIYVHFFVSAIRNLSRRNNSGRLPLLTATWVMLVLGTVRLFLQIGQLAISARLLQSVVTDPMASKQLLGSIEALVFVATVVSVINNFVTDLVLLFRCYAIWEFRKEIVAGPAVLVVASLIVGMSLMIQSRSSISGRVIFICAAITNLVLAALTAGRLWSIQRKTTGLGHDFGRRISRALEIVVESAAIYCITVTILAATAGFHEGGGVVVYQITSGISSQVMNLLPTLALVRGTRRETDRINSPENVLVSGERDVNRPGLVATCRVSEK